MKKLSLLIIPVLVLIDQILKVLVVQNLKPNGVFVLIPNLVEFCYVENSGTAFGMFQNGTLIFIILSAIMMVLVSYLYLKFENHDFFSHYAGIAIIAGGIGNLIDRIRLDFVIDYIHVLFFPYVFNFADALVVTGTVAFCIFYLKYSKDDKKKLLDVGKDGEDK